MLNFVKVLVTVSSIVHYFHFTVSYIHVQTSSILFSDALDYLVEKLLLAPYHILVLQHPSATIFTNILGFGCTPEILNFEWPSK